MGLYNIGVKTRYYGDDAKDTYDDGTGWDYYAINRHSTLMGIPSLLIEHAFMDNSYDLQFLRSDEKLKEMGKRNAQAIIEYYGLQKIIEPSDDIIIEQTTVDILNENEVHPGEPIDLDFSETVKAQFLITKNQEGIINLKTTVYENGVLSFEEVITETVHDIDVILEMLKRCGFEIVQCADQLLLEHTTHSTTWYVVARKPE